MRRGGFGAIAVAIFAALMSLSAAGATAAVPDDPVVYAKGTPLELNSSESGYWTYVPQSYDATNATPTKLLVWLHGCGGYASGDIWTVSPGGTQDWISIAVGGREGGCWDPGADQAKVLAAVADVGTHFNIDPRRVILGGYSSGGDLGYRTAFNHADDFAGLLATNTTPFRDTGATQASSLAAATWKFNVVHVAHVQDTTYPIATVREETGAMVSAGFPVTKVEVDGTHWDAPGDLVNGHSVPGTDADIRSLLLPHIGDGWMSPEPELTEPPDPDPDPDPDPGPDPDPDPDPGPDPDPQPGPGGPKASTSIRSGPAKKTGSKKATFRFRSDVKGLTYQCRLDGSKFHICHSPKRYTGLRSGRHTFRVRAVAGGSAGPVAEYRWTIKRRPHNR